MLSQRIKNYFVESFQELQRVTWPTRNRALNICILVVTFVLISALFIAGIDFVFNRAYTYILSLGDQVSAQPTLDVTPQ